VGTCVTYLIYFHFFSAPPGIEESCIRGLMTTRSISAEGFDYSTRASAMLRHLARNTGMGSFFTNGGASSDAAAMLVPIDILGGGNGTTKASAGAIGFSHLRLAKSLKLQMENHRIDKSSLMESLKLSKVTTTKEPIEWEWDKIDALLEGPLAYNPSALSEVVRNTKFMKRLGGFFRCDPGEKGYFGNLPWTPKNCDRYVKIVDQMLNILMATNDQGGNYGMNSSSAAARSYSDTRKRSGSSPRRDRKGGGGVERESAGLQFLKTDRRGQLIKEIVLHLTSILEYIDSGRSKNNNSSPSTR
jgi:hypothetical protein